MNPNDDELSACSNDDDLSDSYDDDFSSTLKKASKDPDFHAAAGSLLNYAKKMMKLEEENSKLKEKMDKLDQENLGLHRKLNEAIKEKTRYESAWGQLCESMESTKKKLSTEETSAEEEEPSAEAE